jgi:hypothetical protein
MLRSETLQQRLTKNDDNIVMPTNYGYDQNQQSRLLLLKEQNKAMELQIQARRLELDAIRDAHQIEEKNYETKCQLMLAIAQSLSNGRVTHDCSSSRSNHDGKAS